VFAGCRTTTVFALNEAYSDTFYNGFDMCKCDSYRRAHAGRDHQHEAHSVRCRLLCQGEVLGLPS
jgi:hypothetical protein